MLTPNRYKIIGSNMYNEIHNSLTNFPLYLFGFRMGYSTEQCLNVMLEQWEKTLNQKNYVCKIYQTYLNHLIV